VRRRGTRADTVGLGWLAYAGSVRGLCSGRSNIQFVVVGIYEDPVGGGTWSIAVVGLASSILDREQEHSFPVSGVGGGIEMSNTFDRKREHSFPRVRSRVLPTGNENARFLVVGGSGCRVLPSENENARFRGFEGSGCRVLPTENENTRFLGFGGSGCRVLSMALENCRTLGCLGGCGRITRSFKSLG